MWLGKLTALDMALLGWLGRKTSTQTNSLITNFSLHYIQQPMAKWFEPSLPANVVRTLSWFVLHIYFHWKVRKKKVTNFFLKKKKKKKKKWSYEVFIFSIPGISVPRETLNSFSESERSTEVPLSSPPRGSGARAKYSSPDKESSTLDKKENNSSIGESSFC